MGGRAATRNYKNDPEEEFVGYKISGCLGGLAPPVTSRDNGLVESVLS